MDKNMNDFVSNFFHLKNHFVIIIMIFINLHLMLNNVKNNFF